VDACYELFLDLDATEDQIEFPILYASARAGRASLIPPDDGTLPDSGDLEPLFDVIRQHVPAPSYDPRAPLRAHVTNLDASAYLGRIALCRVVSGEISKGQQAAWCRRDGSIERVRISELYRTQALERVPAATASAGDIIAVAGISDIMIGETLADPDDPRPLPLITVDEPAIAMTVGVNTSPLVGKGGPRGGGAAGATGATGATGAAGAAAKPSGRGHTKVTARMVRDRLDAELVGNVSIRVLPTERPDTWEVQGRGELALAILVETMRREGYELTIGRPTVVTCEVDGKLCEPVERLTIDVPEEYLGAVTSLLAIRKGRLEQMTNHGSGWIRLDFMVPARGLIGFRTQFLTDTRGTGIAHHVFERYEPWAGPLRMRGSGSLVADRSGVATAYAMFALQERGTLFVEPGTEVYEGMIVGENSRSDDMDVNIAREKKLTNMRQSTGEELERLVPPRALSLEQALEFCADDECAEVTPATIRLRKTVLGAKERARTRARISREG
jgi:GTP-binding protein